MIAIHSVPTIASQLHLDILHAWLDNWQIKINQAKSSNVTFTTTRTTCPQVTMNNTTIPMRPTVKYIGLYLDQRLTWSTHIKTKRLHLNLKLRSMNLLLGRTSQLSFANKLVLYKCVLKPIWTYGVQLWGYANPSHTQIIQRLQSRILRSITGGPWYVSNLTLHQDLHIPYVVTEIRQLFRLYDRRLANHHNPHVTGLAVLPPIARRLKRQLPTDLLNDPQ